MNHTVKTIPDYLVENYGNQLQQINEALATNEETRKRLEMMRREVINRLGLNKPDGPEDAA